MGEAVGTSRRALGNAFEGGGDGAERGAVKGDEEFFAEKQVEFGGGKFVGAGEIDRVRHHEQVVVVVLDFGEGTRSDAVLDGEGVEVENAFEDQLDLFVGGRFEIDPKDQALVAVDEPKRLKFEVAADELALAEDERVDHGKVRAMPGSAWPGILRRRRRRR